MTPEQIKAHTEARNQFKLYLYDRLKFFVEHTNGSNIKKQMYHFCNDATDVALGKSKEETNQPRIMK